MQIDLPSNKRTAILGATGHIAKGLICWLSGKHELFLFARSPERVRGFLTSTNYGKESSVGLLNEFNDNRHYDVIINCIGMGTPVKLRRGASSVFETTEKFDDLILSYLKDHPEALYINFSSGAAYGTDFDTPVNEQTHSRWDINNITDTNFYGIAKLNSEAKHRAKKELNIVDLRVFNYFSRFIDLESEFLITEIILCIREGRELVTGRDDIFRDYVHPKDLILLIEKCIIKRKLNDVFDVYSSKPAGKFEILDHFSRYYGLKYTVSEGEGDRVVTGRKDNYYSVNKRAQIVGYVPQYTSLDSLIEESGHLLNS